MLDWLSELLGAVFWSAVDIAALRRPRVRDNRGRKRRTIEVLRAWERGMDVEQAGAQALISRLDADACRSVARESRASIAAGLQEQFMEAFRLPRSRVVIRGGRIELTKELSTSLRRRGVKYLNSLEEVFSAWHAGLISDRIVKDQFAFLYDPATGWECMSAFRAALGGAETYPMIEAFISVLRELGSAPRSETRRRE